MVVYASGLSGQVGAVAESTYGTPVTVTHFYEFLSENFQFNPTWLDGQGLKAGQAFNRSARTVQSQFDVNGDLTMEHTIGSASTAVADSMGFWWKYALGSTLVTPTVVLGTAYKQIHTPGSKAGQFITVQVGRPQISGITVQPFTYTGTKVTDWEFSCNDNQIAQLKVTVDGQTELTSTGLAAASYPTPNGVFSFANASVFTIGGTATTSAGETTVAGAAAIGSRVTGIVITGSNPMKVDRYGLGNAGLKGEPIENAIPTITGTLTTEFFSRTELYDLFKANTSTVLELDFTCFDSAGNDANGVASGPNPYRLAFIFPSVRFKTAAMNINGPDVIPQTIGFQAYDDGSGTNPVMQVKLVSKEFERDLMASMGWHMRAAALIIARDAQAHAALWSRQIPPSITVKATGNSAVIKSGVGPAYPNEIAGVVHPVFGPTLRNPHPGHVLNKHRPFLFPAAEAKADAATDEIARYIDDVAYEDGFK